MSDFGVRGSLLGQVLDPLGSLVEKGIEDLSENMRRHDDFGDSYEYSHWNSGLENSHGDNSYNACDTYSSQQQYSKISTGSGDDEVIINQGPGQYPSDGSIPTYAPVAANEVGKVWGDPHFRGGDGDRYDIMGEPGKVYDLLSDTGLDLRGRFDAKNKKSTFVGETGLTVGSGMNSDNIGFTKKGAATINGQRMEKGVTYELADGGTAKLTTENGKDVLTVTTAEGYTIEQVADGERLKIRVTTGEDGVDHGRMPGGLLGQTFDADDIATHGNRGPGAQGEGAIQGEVSDYERESLDAINDNDGWNEDPGCPGDENGDIVRTGSGDDYVEMPASGCQKIGMGSGDDEAFVDLGSGCGNLEISGGSGDDVVTLKGSESDYNVHYEDGKTVYTDRNGSTIAVADDVEEVRFDEDININIEEVKYNTYNERPQNEESTELYYSEEYNSSIFG